MVSSKSTPERPIVEDPEADWAEHEFICWTPRDEPLFALATGLACMGAGVAVWLSTHRVDGTLLALLATLLATYRVWLPAVYRIGPLGIRLRLFRHWMLIPWALVLRIDHRPGGVLLEIAPSSRLVTARQIHYVHAGSRTTILRNLLDRFARHAPSVER